MKHYFLYSCVIFLRCTFLLSHEEYTVIKAPQCICPAEEKVIQQRLDTAHAFIQSFSSTTIKREHIPRIALVGSGGGFRSMIAFTACMNALDSLKLLDVILYSCTLSGSTWAVGTQLAHAMDLAQLPSFLSHQLQNNPDKKRIDSKLIWQQLKRKYSLGRRITFNDIWGTILATILFENLPNKGQDVYLSTTAPLIEQAHHPFPLFTAVHPKTLEWLEFSPFQAGFPLSKMFIPTAAFGKKFNNGISTDPTREETFGYMLGLFGSAYAAHLSDLAQVIVNKLQSLWYKQVLDKAAIDMITKSLRLSVPQVFNFLYNMPTMPYNQTKHLKLVDAGCSFNLPFPPLLERNIDIYIICDASDHSSHSHEHPLLGAERYAQAHGYQFPKIPYNEIMQNEITLIHDTSNPKAPILLYIPNKVHFSTLKFTYSASEFEQLYNPLQNTIQQNRQLFIEAIMYSISNKRLVGSSI